MKYLISDSDHSVDESGCKATALVLLPSLWKWACYVILLG